MISIITPTFNSGGVIHRNLEMMANQRATFEHIIQDGGSTDDTEDVVSSYSSRYNITFHSESDKGIYDAIDKGMGKATGNVLGWLGSDDYYTPWALSTVERVFEKMPEVDWVIGIPTFGYLGGNCVKVQPLAPVYSRRLIRSGYHRHGLLPALSQESMFWRRSLWEKAGAGDLMKKYKYAGDYHLWKAFADHAELHTVSSVLAVFSKSETQTSHKFHQQYMEEVGFPAPEATASRLGFALLRVMSLCLNKRIIRPEFL